MNIASTLYNTIDSGFLSAQTFDFQNSLAHLTGLLALIFLTSLLISAVTAGSYPQPASRHNLQINLALRLKDFWKHYLSYFKQLLNYNLNKDYFSYNLLSLLLALLNIGLLLLFPLSRQLRGVQSDYSYLTIVMFLLLNLTTCALVIHYDKSMIAVNLRNSRMLISVLLVIITATASVSLYWRSLSISAIVQAQQEKLFYTLPAWNSLRSPVLFLNGIIGLIYIVILFQLLTQTDWPVPGKIPATGKTARTFSDTSTAIWKFSFLILVIFLYIFIFWGGPFPASSAEIGLKSNFSGIFQLFIKIGILLIIVRGIYRSVPHLIEEQIIQLTYTYIFPAQMIALMLLIIVRPG